MFKKVFCKKRRGFTLIELLAIVIIVGVIASIAIPSIVKSIQTGKEAYVSNLKDQLMLSAKDYYSSNDEELPNGQIVNGDEIKTISQVWISQLESGNYLSNDVKDPDGGSCSKSFVLVTNNNNEYDYKVCLKCDNDKYNDDNIYCQQLSTLEKDYKAPTCVITYGDYVPGTWSTKPVTVTFTGIPDPFHDNIVNITGFENRGVNPPEEQKSSGKGTKTYQQTFDETTTLDFWVYDNNGKTAQCKGDALVNTNNIKVDTIPPQCTIKMVKQNEDKDEYKNNYWTKYNVKVSWECSDGESGLDSKSKGSKTFKGTGKHYFNLEVKDKAGNSKTYSKTIKIDQTDPICGSVEGESTKWTKDNRYISVGCYDNDSGCSKDRFGHEYDTSGKISYKTIKDIVGNTTKCTVNKYIDKTNPSCWVSSTSFGDEEYYGHEYQFKKGEQKFYANLYFKPVTVTIKCSDTYSGLATSSSLTKSITSKGTKTLSYSAKDNVGHVYTGSVTEETPTTKHKWYGYNATYSKVANCRNISNKNMYCNREHWGVQYVGIRYESTENHKTCDKFSIWCKG